MGAQIQAMLRSVRHRATRCIQNKRAQLEGIKLQQSTPSRAPLRLSLILAHDWQYFQASLSSFEQCCKHNCRLQTTIGTNLGLAKPIPQPKMHRLAPSKGKGQPMPAHVYRSELCGSSI
eukprot:1700122-Amphidinium_carterae.1